MTPEAKAQLLEAILANDGKTPEIVAPSENWYPMIMKGRDQIREKAAKLGLNYDLFQWHARVDSKRGVVYFPDVDE